MRHARCRPRTKEMTRTLVDPLRSIFSCNLTAVDRQVFLTGFMRAHWTRNLSFALQSFRRCNRWQPVQTLAKCLVPLTDKCRRSDIVAVKVIRLHMSHADQLLSNDADLRLIHVVRDPRGMIESWKRLAAAHRRSMFHMRLNAKLICQRMLTDCRIRSELELKYPGRILLLRYEDLVAAPDTVIDHVYNGLLQLALPSNVVNAIKRQLHATSGNGPTGTLRRNGTATAANWHRTIDSELLTYTTFTCRQLLDQLHYN